MRAFATFLALTCLAAEPAVWLQWRGPTRDGQVPGNNWPDSLKPEVLTKTWTVSLAPSYSGPIVTPDRVITTETRDKKTEATIALDRSSGKELWKTEWPGAMTVPFFAAANGSWIRSTPACDGECVYVAGMRDVLVALELKDGKERWRLDFMKEFKSPLPAFGFVCSPLIDGEMIYVQAGASCFALDKKTGQVRWRSLKDDGGMMGSAFSSPHISTVAGKRQLLVQTRLKLVGLNPEDGAVLWERPIPAMRGMNILTPVVYKDSLFTSAYGGKSLLLNLTPSGDGFQVGDAWTNKVEGYMSTPVVIGDYAYLHLRNQRVTCIDLRDGKNTWTTDKPYGKYWSMVAQKDKILALDEKGILYYFRANPEKFDLIDSRKVAESEAWAHLAVCGDEIFIRELNALTAWRWKTK